MEEVSIFSMNRVVGDEMHGYSGQENHKNRTIRAYQSP